MTESAIVNAVRAASRERLEAGKIPRSFVLTEQLPRTPTGKVDKRALLAVPDAEAPRPTEVLTAE